ncbi:MAG: outer membrane lipoprotein chaperone LolA [Granulosicoccus sp.]|nr:outer membrane lipoprotein chaperone LolA [Granulosicoccus sp.]
MYLISASALFRRWALTLGLLLLPGILAAEDLSRLTNFTDNLESFSANFEQTLYNADSDPLKSSTGSIILKRPGRFVWDYKTPDLQTIVSDGEKVWLYDQELEQVTVSPLTERASGTPLALLMGGTPLDDAFAIKALGEAEGIAWFELTPKTSDTDFEQIFLGLNDAGLAVMELRDSFDQATQIRFSDFVSGVALDDKQFEFVPPDGVDVIGQ